MKVLIVSQDYPPRPLGGVGRHVESLSQALRKIGVDTTVLVPDKGTTEITPGVIRAPSIGPSAKYPYTLFQENQAMTVAGIQICAQQQFDLIHCHDYHAFLAGSALALFTKRPLIMTKHFVKESNKNIRSSDPLVAFREKNSEYFTALERWSLDQPERIICVSHDVLADIHAVEKSCAQKSVVIYNGTNIDQFQSEGPIEAVRARYCAPAEKLLLVVGRLNWRKGGDLAIRALHVLRQYPLRLLFIGEGPDLDALKKLAMELDVVDKISFAGFVEGSALADLYRCSDMVLVPSRSEAFGLVVQEALALGKVVIGSNIGGIKEQIEDGQNGFLFASENQEDLARKIQWVLKHEDHIRFSSPGNKGYQTYSWNTIAIQTLQEYEALLHISQ